MIILKPVPIMPDQAPANKYSVPISLWLQDHNHLILNLIISQGSVFKFYLIKILAGP